MTEETVSPGSADQTDEHSKKLQNENTQLTALLNDLLAKQAKTMTTIQQITTLNDSQALEIQNLKKQIAEFKSQSVNDLNTKSLTQLIEKMDKLLKFFNVDISDANKSNEGKKQCSSMFLISSLFIIAQVSHIILSRRNNSTG